MIHQHLSITILKNAAKELSESEAVFVAKMTEHKSEATEKQVAWLFKISDKYGLTEKVAKLVKSIEKKKRGGSKRKASTRNVTAKVKRTKSGVKGMYRSN